MVLSYITWHVGNLQSADPCLPTVFLFYQCTTCHRS